MDSESPQRERSKKQARDMSRDREEGNDRGKPSNRSFLRPNPLNKSIKTETITKRQEAILKNRLKTLVK